MSPFMKGLESRLANPAFQRGVTEMGLSILANSGPSSQPRSFGQVFAQGGLQGMGAYREESARQAALQQQQAEQQRQEQQRQAAQEAAGSIDDPALRRLAAADPALARDFLMRQYDRENISALDQAKLGQGQQGLDIRAEQATADQALAGQRLDLQRQGLDQRAQQHAASLAQQKANQPLVEVMGEDGQVRYVPRNQAVGQQAPKKAPLVNVDMGKRSELAEKRLNNVFEKADAARQRKAKAESLLSLNDAALSGFGADQRLLAGKVGNFAGIGDGETVAATEAMRAGLSEIVLQKQIEQKGPQTESDAKRLEKTVGNLTTSKVARETLLNAAVEDQKYQIAYGDRVEDLVEQDMTLSDATKQAREELGDAPDLVKVYEDLAAGNEPEQSQEQNLQFEPAQIQSIEEQGEALVKQYVANGMSEEEAFQLATDELRKGLGQ